MGALAASQFLRLIAGFGVNLLIARWLGPDDLGLYAFIGGIAALSHGFINLGAFLLITREVARNTSFIAKHLGAAIANTFIMGLVMSAVTLLFVYAFDPRPHVLLATFTASLSATLLCQSQLLQAVIHGLQRMHLQLPGELIGRSVFLLASVGFLAMGGGVAGVYAAQALAALFTFVGWWFALRRSVPELLHQLQLKPNLGFAKRSAPFALNIIFGTLYLRGDLVLLKIFSGDRAVGIYYAAALLLLFLPLFAEVLNRGLYPHLAQHIDHPQLSGQIVSLSIRLLLAFSVPIAVGGAFLAGPLLNLLFGSRYPEATLPFICLIALVPIRYINSTIGMALSALNAQTQRTRAVGLVATLNLSLNLIAIPLWGVMGAVLTTTLSEILLFCLFSKALKPLVHPISIKESVLRISLASALMGLCLQLKLPLFFLLPIGASAYLIGGYLLKAYTLSDLQRLRALR